MSAVALAVSPCVEIYPACGRATRVHEVETRTRTASACPYNPSASASAMIDLRIGRQPRAGVADDAGPLDEVVDAEGRGIPRRAAGGKDMARARDVVADRLGRVVAQEDGAGVPHRSGDSLRALGDDLEMLRRPAVGHLDRVAHPRHQDHDSVPLERFPGDLGARGAGQRLFERGGERVGQGGIRRDAPADGVLVVLGLGDRSAATRDGRAVESAIINTSVGPAIMSMPTSPTTWRLASATQRLPGPTILSTLGMVRFHRQAQQSPAHRRPGKSW